jgi:excisionase family DNA binding protein
LQATGGYSLTAPKEKETADWLTLSQVAKMLGVHPSTVRKWSDKGHLPSYRTQGGHRRFRRQELDLWTKSERKLSKAGSTSLVRSALIYTRLQISEGSLETEKWYAKLDQNAREEYRRSGRRLMQSLSNFLASNEKKGRAEAHAAGYDYAMLGRRHGLNSLEATRAYLFFRSALQEALLTDYETAAIHSAEAWREMIQKIEAFTNQVLVSLLETYQIAESKNK